MKENEIFEKLQGLDIEKFLQKKKKLKIFE
jgi:hypothetical protein